MHFLKASRILVCAFALAYLPHTAFAANPGMPLRTEGAKSIEMAPSLSIPSVKNGGTLTISVRIQSTIAIAKVLADIEGIESVELKPSTTSAGFYTTDWLAHSLTEKNYRVLIRATDVLGATTFANPLQFSDPIAGNDKPGTNVYPSNFNGANESITNITTAQVIRAFCDTKKGMGYYLTAPNLDNSDSVTHLIGLDLKTGATVLGPISIVNFQSQSPGYGLGVGFDSENGFAYFCGRTTQAVPKPFRAYRLNMNLVPPAIDRQINDIGAENPTDCLFDPVRKQLVIVDGFVANAKAIRVDADPTHTFAVMDTTTIPGLGFSNDPYAIDPEAGFMYVGRHGSPPRLIKFDLKQSPIQEVDSIPLEGSELNFTPCAAIDTKRGYAYFCNGLKIIKFDISPQRIFRRVDSRFYLLGDGGVLDMALDIDGGSGVARAAIVGGDKCFRFNLETLAMIGSVVSIPGGFTHTSFIDPGTGYYYDRIRVDLKGSTLDGLPVKVADSPAISSASPHVATTSALYGDGLFYGSVDSTKFSRLLQSNLSQAPTVLDLTPVSPRFTEINASTGHAYVVSLSNGQGGACPIAKVNVGNFGSAPAITTVNLNNELCGKRDPRMLALDAGNGSGYVGLGYTERTNQGVLVHTSPPRLVKFKLNAGDAAPTWESTTLLPATTTHMDAGAIDAVGGFLYASCVDISGGPDAGSNVLHKYKLGAGAPELIGTYRIPTTQCGAVLFNIGAHLDVKNGYIYFIGGGGYTQVTRVKLGDGSNAPGPSESISLDPTEVNTQIFGFDSLTGTVGSGGSTIDTVNGYLYVGCRTGKVVKIDLKTFRRLGSTTVGGGATNNFFAGGLYNPTTNMLFFSSNSASTDSFVTQFQATGNQQNMLKGYKIAVPEIAVVKNVKFYSHNNTGNVRLAIYDNSEPKKLIWQANAATPNLLNAWVQQDISAGTPSTLTLQPGTYNLAWQVDTIDFVPSFSKGSPGDGFTYYQAFGAFNASISQFNSTPTDQVWSQYITYETLPSVTTSAGTSSYVQGGVGVPIDANVLVKDSDNVLTGATVALASGYDPLSDLIEFTPVGNITVTSNANGVLALAGSATQAQWQAALRTVKFRNSSLAPIVLPRTATFTVTDGTTTSPTATKLVNISAPTLDLIPNQTVLEDSGVNSVALTGISSPGGFLEFIYTSDNTSLIPNSAQSTSISGTSSLLNFTPASNANGVANITVTVRISNGTPGQQEAMRSFTVTVTPVNDAPVASNQNLSVKTQNPLIVTLSATDVENSSLTYQVISSPQNGALTGTAPNLVYTSNASYTGPDSFTFRANDGTADSALATVSITVTAVTTIPTVTSLSQTTGTLNQAAFTLTITGTNFVNGAVASWNGTALSTTFVSPTQVTAQVTSAELAMAGQIPVLVTNPVPNMIASNSIPFSLYSGVLGNYIVTNTNDSGQGSLRLALASVRNGDSVIFDPTVFDLVNSDAETLINVLSELPPMDDGNVTIDASNRRVSVNGSGANSARGLVVNSDNNTIRGLTLLGFARSGISLLPGAANNSIGGGRSVGGGPNGQGLRISGNGTYGIEILGAGTTGNTVKGCWIGLDAGGSGALPNLAGIIIGDGATDNTIGSTLADEENIISGNSLEGVTVAGSGTNDNVVIGNTVGASAAVLSSRAVQSREGIPGRGAVANGSAGLFLSKGTNGTKNGGTNAGEGNSVAFNGGNGVEVRSPNARKNSARGNRVTANSRGGIALFDGSNDNIKAPVLESFLRIPTKPTASALGRSAISARVKGSTGGSGQIEFFNDSGAQGAVILGRSTVINGAFEAEIDVDDLLNLTATFTDENGNTSPFGFFGRASGNAGTEDDTDGDGFSNTVETLAGTDPLNAAQAPTSAGTLSVDSSRISLNFASTNRDSLGAVIRVALPDGFELSQSTAGLLFGAVSKNFTLDSKLRSPKAVSTLKALKSRTGPGAAFAFALKNEDLKKGLAASGLTDATTAKTGDDKIITVMLTLKSAAGASYAYAGTVTLTYKATQGKSGKAANAK